MELVLVMVFELCSLFIMLVKGNSEVNDGCVQLYVLHAPSASIIRDSVQFHFIKITHSKL